MSLHELPTVWNVYNLRGSPFFQDTLLNGHDRYSLDLFVGRANELAALRAHLRGRDSSRQAVAGTSGVGKTTLVQMLKAEALRDGYLTADSLVPFVTGDTPEAFFGRVLNAVYDIILANRPRARAHPAMQAAQQMVRAARFETGGASVSALGVGGGITRGVTIVTPKDILIDGPRVLRDLLTLVLNSDARGLLLHLNNLESLSGRDLSRAADLLQSLRDPMFMHEGLHVVLVGTTDAVNDVLGAHPQVRNVFRAPLVLDPLSLAEVHALLMARYEGWRLDDRLPVHAPVEGAAVDRLFEAFQGDLRGLLKALDDGVEECIGMGAPELGGEVVTTSAGVPPVALHDLARVLQARYAAVMRGELDDTRIEQLDRWAMDDPDASRTQRDLMELWDLSQGTVSTALSALDDTGYVIAHPRQGNAPIHYTLSGKSRVVAGLA